jgi:hypothetical protein
MGWTPKPLRSITPIQPSSISSRSRGWCRAGRYELVFQDKMARRCDRDRSDVGRRLRCCRRRQCLRHGSPRGVNSCDEPKCAIHHIVCEWSRANSASRHRSANDSIGARRRLSDRRTATPHRSSERDAGDCRQSTDQRGRAAEFDDSRSADTAAALGITDPLLAHDLAMTVHGAAAEQLDGRVHRFALLAIGTETIRNPEIGVTDLRLGDADLVLGVDFFNHNEYGCHTDLSRFSCHAAAEQGMALPKHALNSRSGPIPSNPSSCDFVGR